MVYLDDNVMTLLCGSSRSGKTYLLLHLLKYAFSNNKLKKDNGIIFSGTKFTDQFSNLGLSSKYIYDNSDDIPAIIDKFLEFIKKNKNKNQRYYMIFDDMLGDIKFQHKTIKHLLCNYRHYKISIFFTCQQCSSLNSSLFKQQITHAFIFPCNFTKRSILNLYECCGYSFENEKEFAEHIHKITNGQQYHCMFYDSTENDTNMRYQDYHA